MSTFKQLKESQTQRQAFGQITNVAGLSPLARNIRFIKNHPKTKLMFPDEDLYRLKTNMTEKL